MERILSILSSILSIFKTFIPFRRSNKKSDNLNLESISGIWFMYHRTVEKDGNEKVDSYSWEIYFEEKEQRWCAKGAGLSHPNVRYVGKVDKIGPYLHLVADQEGHGNERLYVCLDLGYPSENYYYTISGLAIGLCHSAKLIALNTLWRRGIIPQGELKMIEDSFCVIRSIPCNKIRT